MENGGRSKAFLSWWPVILTVAAVGASAVRADTNIADQRERIDYLYENGSPSVSARLARIEAGQEAVTRQLDRIEDKLAK